MTQFIRLCSLSEWNGPLRFYREVVNLLIDLGLESEIL